MLQCLWGENGMRYNIHRSRVQQHTCARLGPKSDPFPLAVRVLGYEATPLPLCEPLSTYFLVEVVQILKIKSYANVQRYPPSHNIVEHRNKGHHHTVMRAEYVTCATLHCI